MCAWIQCLDMTGMGSPDRFENFTPILIDMIIKQPPDVRRHFGVFGPPGWARFAVVCIRLLHFFRSGKCLTMF